MGLGMCCSVNDCLVAAVDGNVFRDICKDYRISSEKFSYVLDATAAPAAALFISDWIAYQISMIGQGLDMAGITGITAVSAYVNGLPFNMYSILTLIFVGLLMYTGRDYGPMLKAEVRALTKGEFISETAKPMLDVGSELGEAKKTKPMIRCFVLICSSLVAFATGTSWRTMAIMTPLAIQLGYAVTGDILFSTGMTGAVLSGAIFGDHCSPVSDTTVMASIFSGADHIDHVATQIPYSITVISVIAVLYIIFGFTRVSPFILLPIGIVALYFLQIILHKFFLKKYNIDPDYAKFMTADHK